MTSRFKWMLDTRKKYKCSIPAAINLYWNYGRQELNSISHYKASKHIEFTGMSGSGKTTLSKLANKYLKQHLGYYPGPAKSWMEAPFL